MSQKFIGLSTGDDSFHSITDTSNAAQTFTVDYSFTIEYVKLKIYRVGSPGDVTISLTAVAEGLPSGSALASVTVASSSITTGTSDWNTFTFDSSYTTTGDTKYAITIDMASGDASNQLRWRVDTDAGYAGGSRCWWTDANGYWLEDTTDDFLFELWGTSSPPVDKKYTRSLIAIANNEFWYESSAGTMTELTAANGDLFTVNSLSATEAYQKIFIANGSKLKVADFTNTKINTSDAGTNPCTPGMTLTGATSAASMIVDYVDGVTDDAAMNVYGYRTTIATFRSGETVTGTNSDGNAVSFVTSAAETDPPHWYTWTVFGQDTTTYGTMLSKPTLVCLYRGRIVIAGDSQKPYAWQMFKVGIPWKVKYDFANDGDLSAVTYSNAQVGKLGDVIVALIPYKDDLLIFGCANSIWVLVGDPLAGGQLAEVTHHTGIWGPDAWCIDLDKNLYFLGADGVYRMPISSTTSPPINMSKDKIPNLMSDLALDKDNHRVVLSYDPQNYGIIISKTTLDGGSNTNYFYSLLTGGFFPETYPDNCGIFSSHFYPATDDTYTKFLVGCDDGYIREFDNSTKDDATTSSTQAISSYCTIIKQISPDISKEGMLIRFSGVMAGGASGGDFSDSDGLSFELHKAADAETVLENIKDGATAFASGSWSTTGRQQDSLIRMRGVWAGIKLYNSTASQTWAIERLFGDIKAKGKKR